MAKPFQLILTPAQTSELHELVSRHPLPYVRERAAALLKVASGLSMREVALSRLLTVHEPDTIKVWISRYLLHGPRGLLILPGRGRKPAFFPSDDRTGQRGTSPYRTA